MQLKEVFQLDIIYSWVMYITYLVNPCRSHCRRVRTIRSLVYQSVYLIENRLYADLKVAAREMMLVRSVVPMKW